MNRPQTAIWLVWALLTSGQMVVVAVCTEREFAEEYRDREKRKPQVIRVWVEGALTNHPYGADMRRSGNPVRIGDSAPVVPR